MLKGKRILCVIPARGGSKGLAGKNIKRLYGKPLLAYAIKDAKASKYIDRIIVSTDSKKIAEIAAAYGAEAPFIRPKGLAGDKSSVIGVLLHAIDWVEKKENYNFDILALLHANTPLRSVRDIDNCIELLFKRNTDNVFSVSHSSRNPYFNMVEYDSHRHIRLVKKGNFVNRQAAPPVYDMNSSIYVWWKNKLKQKKRVFLKNSRIYIMPKERSIDIDDQFDFKVTEMFMLKNKRK